MKHSLEMQALTRRQFLARMAVGVATATVVPVLAALPSNTGKPTNDDMNQSTDDQNILVRPFVLTF